MNQMISFWPQSQSLASIMFPVVEEKHMEELLCYTKVALPLRLDLVIAISTQLLNSVTWFLLVAPSVSHLLLSDKSDNLIKARHYYP